MLANVFLSPLAIAALVTVAVAAYRVCRRGVNRRAVAVAFPKGFAGSDQAAVEANAPWIRL